MRFGLLYIHRIRFWALLVYTNCSLFITQLRRSTNGVAPLFLNTTSNLGLNLTDAPKILGKVAISVSLAMI